MLGKAGLAEEDAGPAGRQAQEQVRMAWCVPGEAGERPSRHTGVRREPHRSVRTGQGLFLTERLRSVSVDRMRKWKNTHS